MRAGSGVKRCRSSRKRRGSGLGTLGQSLSQLFAWGGLTEAEYRRQKIEAERDLTMLPDDDKLVLFDLHRRLMVSMAENVAAAPLGSSGSLP